MAPVRPSAHSNKRKKPFGISDPCIRDGYSNTSKPLRLVVTLVIEMNGMPLSDGEIRARILRLHYDLEMKSSGQRFDTDELSGLIPDVPQNLLDANLNYLFQSRLIDGEMVAGRAAPIGTMITPAGIDVVEKPSDASHHCVNLQVLQVATNYGQIAQASQNSTVAQTQTVTFGSLRRMVQDRDDMCESEKAAILGILEGLEKDARCGTLTKTAVEKAKQALTKYAWLMQPLMVLLKAYFGFP